MQKKVLLIISISLFLIASLFFIIYKFREPYYTAERELKVLQTKFGIVSDTLYSGFISFGEPVYDENGEQYYEISPSNGYETIEELREVISEVYTVRYTEEELNKCLTGDLPLIKVIDGKLCRRNAYMFQAGFTFPLLSARRINSREIVVAMDSNGMEFYTSVTLILENGKWRIDNIDLI